MSQETQRRPSIFVFTTAYFPLIGGAEVAIHEIAKRLKQYDWALFCARLDRSLPKRETIDNMRVFRLGWGLGRLDKIFLPFTSFFAARRLLIKPQFSNHESRIMNQGSANRNSRFVIRNSNVILWAVMASYGAFGALFLKLLSPRLPFILTLQEGDSERHVRRGLVKAGPFRWILFARIDFLTAISSYLGSLARRLGYYGLIKIIPNGVDRAKFNDENLPLKDKAIKKSLGIPAGERVIVTVSRLVEKNGLRYLIAALGSIKRCRLFIIGEGPLENALKQQVKTLGIAGVHFFGALPNEEVPHYLGIADVFVRPSLSEGLGISFLEAMAMGVPIVGTPVGGIPDFLTDGETGLFCEPRNPESIAAAVEKILSDDALRTRLIENAYRLVRERYDWDKIAGGMEKVFSKYQKPKMKD